jgi:hypothetical protein
MRLLLALVSMLVLAMACVDNTRVEVYVPFRDNAIDRAIEVGALENKFVVMRRMGFGGGGAGGMGAPQVTAVSSEQFVEMVADGETIYSSVESGLYSSGRPNRKAIRTYWAFIENRAGLLIWNEVYQVGYPYPASCYLDRVEGRVIVFRGGHWCHKVAEDLGYQVEVVR